VAVGTAFLSVAANTEVLLHKRHLSLFPGYVMPICLLHGNVMTKNYVGKTSEVAGWGIYETGAKGALVKDEPTSNDTRSLHKMCPWHKLLFSTLILA